MLDFDGLYLDYGGPSVIRGASARVHPGEVVALLGINGAGKTTLLHGLMGFLRPRRGRITLEGAGIGGLPSYEISRRGLSLVPQGRRIFKSLTVRENLTLAMRQSTQSHWNLTAVLELFPALGERLTHGGQQLSGGEQQMLAWARALLTNPSIILMDEPTEGLSPRLVRMLGELIPRLKAEKLGIFLAEQNIEFACNVADRVLILVNGTVRREISREELDRDGIRGEAAVRILADSVQGLC